MKELKPRIKICGITTIEQALHIAELGVDAIGIISVKESPRYVSEENKKNIFQTLKNYYPNLKRVSVYKNAPLSIVSRNCYGTTVQLHGDESINYCKDLKDLIPEIEIWKAFRVKSKNELRSIRSFENLVDAILLDSWNRGNYGGSGKRIDGIDLKKLEFNKPWWLAGGVSIDWIDQILKEIKPDGIDISSSIEISPGEKDLEKTKRIIEKVKKSDEL